MSVAGLDDVDWSVDRREAVDLLLPFVAAARAGAHGFAYKLATGEEPNLDPSWGRSTALADYGDLDAVGRLAVRVMPAGFGAVFAEIATMPFRIQPSGPFGTGGQAVAVPDGWVLAVVAYAAVLWCVFVAYDPVCGLCNLLRGDSTP